jgi:2-keto-3-deoxy-L-rhamnonate aldolase RhmA
MWHSVARQGADGRRTSPAVFWSGTEIGVDPATTTALLSTVHPTVNLSIGVFVLGHVVGTVLFGVALLRTGVIPAWAAWALTVSQPLHFVVAVFLDNPPLDLFAWSLTTLAMAVAARVLLPRSAGAGQPQEQHVREGCPNMPRMDLFVFTVDPRRAFAVVAAGAAGVIVDWERRDKARRQEGADTQINEDTAEDLARVRAATAGRVLCRVNGPGPWTPDEIALAADLGADEVLLPMVRTAGDVDLALDAAAGRCGVGILVETQDAVDRVGELTRRPLSRVYVGLNDLRIDRGADTLFEPLVDGTVEAVRSAVTVPFGVAGLTRPDAGSPVPSRLLAAELVRIGADFTFLRRSFHTDTAGRDLSVEIPRIQAGCAAAGRRTASQIFADRAELVAAVAPTRVPARV